MKQQSELLDTLSYELEGMTLSALLQQHPEIARRTAQRRLQTLVTEGRVELVGEGKSTRYRKHPTVYEQPLTPCQYRIAEEGSSYDGIPLSIDARDVLEYVSGPPSARKPVGYNRRFVDTYQPNQTFYLPSIVRKQLHGIGQTVVVETPAGTFVKSVMERLLIDLSWASSNLEGNTYSWLDTSRLIEQGTVAQGKQQTETRMILNHKQAIEMLVDNIDVVNFDHPTLMNVHDRLATGLLHDVNTRGKVRQKVVQIGRSVYQPLAMTHQLEEMLDIILNKAQLIEDPFEQSFFAMVHLPYLQPFLDVNKRTSRLMANLPLFKKNLCPLAFLDVPVAAYNQAMLGVYEMNRIELLRDLYVWAYDRSVTRYIVFEDAMGEADYLLLKHDVWFRQTMHDIIKQPEDNPLNVIDKAVLAIEQPSERQHMRDAAIFELKYLHEGGIMKYKLTLDDLNLWRKAHGTNT